jgi:hypothetical protein
MGYDAQAHLLPVHLDGMADSGGLDLGGFPIVTALTQSLREGLLAYQGNIDWAEAALNVGVRVGAVGAGASIGSAIGTFFFPGVGTVIGGAVGGWLGGLGGREFVEREVNRARRTFLNEKENWERRAEASRNTLNIELQNVTTHAQQCYLARLNASPYFLWAKPTHRPARRRLLLGWRAFDRITRLFSRVGLGRLVRKAAAQRLAHENHYIIRAARINHQLSRRYYREAICVVQGEFNRGLKRHAATISAMVQSLNDCSQRLRDALKRRGRA